MKEMESSPAPARAPKSHEAPPDRDRALRRVIHLISVCWLVSTMLFLLVIGHLLATRQRLEQGLSEALQDIAGRDRVAASLRSAQRESAEREARTSETLNLCRNFVDQVTRLQDCLYVDQRLPSVRQEHACLARWHHELDPRRAPPSARH